MRLPALRLADAWARSRVPRDEDGIALVLTIVVMVVLAVILTTVLFLTASSNRDAHRTNAGQAAYALAESGISSALSVLNASYPSSVAFPGDASLITGTTTGEAGCSQLLPNTTTNAVWCKSSMASGDVYWTGSLDAATDPTVSWTYQWNLTAVGYTKNPTGPGVSDVSRTVKAVVPVVIPNTSSVNPTTSTLNWIYGTNITFSQSVVVRAPVYASSNLTLQGTAVIAENVPADTNTAAHSNSVNVLGNIYQANVGNNQNHIGRVDSTTSPALGKVYVGGQCSIANQNGGSLHTCIFNSTASTGSDWIFRPVTPPSGPDTVNTPDMSCCTGVGKGGPVVADAAHDESPTSVMAFWYTNADLGPKHPCYSYTSTGTISTPLTFDKQGVAQTAAGADNTLDESATAGTAAFNLTPKNAGYACVSGDGLKWIKWNGTNAAWNGIPKNTLEVQGTIFIDGSVTVTAGTNGTQPAQYVGKSAIIMSGTFLMQTGSALCVNVSGSGCNTTAAWDPNLASLFIFAHGDFGTDLSTQKTNSYTGYSIEINKGQFMGGLFGNKVVDASVTGTVTDGPMISAYSNVFAGQSGVLQFPAISFPSSGTDGFTGPLPIAYLLTPRYFTGG